MIIEIRQTKNRPKPEYEIKNHIDDSLIATADAHNIAYPIIYDVKGNKIGVHLSPKISKRIDGKKRIIYDVTSNDNVIGGIFQSLVVQKKILFIPIGYDYYGLQFNDKLYQVFEVGLGGDQHYLCFYLNDKLVGIVHKHMRVINNLDTYIAYIDDEKDTMAIILFTIFIDELDYFNSDEILAYKRRDEEYISINKELNSKFDPNFIPKIKSKHGIKE